MVERGSVSPRAIITLTTDFGLTDSYVAQMKGVILSFAPHVQMVDLTHFIPRYEISAGARFLREATAVFPPETIHLAVVDPGVGGARRRLIIRCREPKGFFFVGPDNGLLTLAAPCEAREEVLEIIPELLETAQLRSDTFEGRDVFAPVAAKLAAGENLTLFTRPVSPTDEPPVEICNKAPKVNPGGEVTGEVVHLDSFGNAVTNISAKASTPTRVIFRGIALPIVEFYEQMAFGELSALVGSSGYIELSCRSENAARECCISVGEVVKVEFVG